MTLSAGFYISEKTDVHEIMQRNKPRKKNVNNSKVGLCQCCHSFSDTLNVEERIAKEKADREREINEAKNQAAIEEYLRNVKSIFRRSCV